MVMVPTVRGPVDVSTLGPTFMHEHVFVISPEMKDNVPEEWGDEDHRMDDQPVLVDQVATNEGRGERGPTDVQVAVDLVAQPLDLIRGIRMQQSAVPVDVVERSREDELRHRVPDAREVALDR